MVGMLMRILSRVVICSYIRVPSLSSLAPVAGGVISY